MEVDFRTDGNEYLTESRVRIERGIPYCVLALESNLIERATKLGGKVNEVTYEPRDDLFRKDSCQQGLELLGRRTCLASR